MSDPKIQSQPQQKASPDLAGFFRGLARQKGTQEKKAAFDEFLSSNKNNPTKSRNPNPAALAVYQTLGLFHSTKKTMRYKVQGSNQDFPRTVEGLHVLFKGLLDENSISYLGKSREEAETVALGYFLQDIESIHSAQQERLGEGGGSARK